MNSPDAWARPAVRRTLWIALPLAFGVHLAAGWTHALPVVDAWIWLLQVAGVRVDAPGLTDVGLDQTGFLAQAGAFHAATGRAFVTYEAWGQLIARVAGLDAVLWKIANLTLIFGTFGWLAALQRRLDQPAWPALACLTLLLVPLADRPGFDACAYLTSAEAPALFLIAASAWFATQHTRWAGVAIALSLAAAGLCKESTLAFAPAVLLLRYRTLRHLGRAAWPGIVALAIVAAVMLGLRARYPVTAHAYTGFAVVRGPFVPALRRVLLSLAGHVALPVAAGTPGDFARSIGVRALWFVLLCGVLLLAGLRLRLWAWARREPLLVWTAVAWLAGGLATLLVYWAMGRDLYADFHGYPGAFGLAVALATASGSVAFVPPRARLVLPVVVAFALVSLWMAATTSEGATLGALAAVVAGALAWAVVRPQGAWLALALLVFLPRVGQLVQIRERAIQEPESLQSAVDRMARTPPGSIVHIELGRPGNVEYANSLRAYTILRGRGDVRTCVTAAAKAEDISPYALRQFHLAEADEPQSPHPAPVLDVVIEQGIAPAPVLVPAWRDWWSQRLGSVPVTAVAVRRGTVCPSAR